MVCKWQRLAFYAGSKSISNPLPDDNIFCLGKTESICRRQIKCGSKDWICVWKDKKIFYKQMLVNGIFLRFTKRFQRGVDTSGKDKWIISNFQDNPFNRENSAAN